MAFYSALAGIAAFFLILGYIEISTYWRQMLRHKREATPELLERIKRREIDPILPPDPTRWERALRWVFVKFNGPLVGVED